MKEVSDQFEGNDESNHSKKVLNEKVLEMGDIVLTTSPALISDVIRRKTKSDISHAILYVDDRSIIDSTAEGVHAQNTQRFHIPASLPVYALRLRRGLTKDQANGIVEYVRLRIGTQYSRSEAIRAGFSGSGKFTRKQFCSRLVAQAYASVGIKIVKNSNFCSPADLKNSSMLEQIPSPTRAISAEDVRRWEGRRDLPQMMRSATVAVLEKARTRNKNIQDLNDIVDHLIKVPSDDDFIEEAYRVSGYLDLWRFEVEQNPSHYDSHFLATISKQSSRNFQDVVDYCLSVVISNDNNNAGSRFYDNRKIYAVLEYKYRLKTFSTLRKLYEQLVDNYERRLSVARRWLFDNNIKR